MWKVVCENSEKGEEGCPQRLRWPYAPRKGKVTLIGARDSSNRPSVSTSVNKHDGLWLRDFCEPTTTPKRHSAHTPRCNNIWRHHPLPQCSPHPASCVIYTCHRRLTHALDKSTVVTFVWSPVGSTSSRTNQAFNAPRRHTRRPIVSSRHSNTLEQMGLFGTRRCGSHIKRESFQ